MFIGYEDGNVDYVHLEYVPERNEFVISDNDKIDSIFCKAPLELDDKFSVDNFIFFRLKSINEQLSENDIYSLYIQSDSKKLRVGWIFPIQSLCSKEHGCSDNKNFLRCAFVAYSWLLDSINTKEINRKMFYSKEISLLDFYNDKEIVMVIDKDEIGKIIGFDIADYCVDLYRKGYSLNQSSDVSLRSVEKFDKNITIRKISDQLSDSQIIKSLFLNEIPKKYNEEFARFYTYYQLIEIMMGIVFKDKFGSFVETLKDGSKNVFDKREELSEMTSEKKRIDWLINNYTGINSEGKIVLDEFCKKFLEEHNKPTENNLAKNLYKVRCFLVHELYLFDKSNTELLRKINDQLLDVVIEMLFTYGEATKHSNNSREGAVD